MGSLVQVASRIANAARESEILISSDARKLLEERLENVKFRARKDRVEVDLFGDVVLLELYEVTRIITVDLTEEEKAELFGQDPSSRSGGGFQALLVSLQERVKDNKLDLNIADRERIARYAHDYRSGGWQGRLRKIFGRTLGSNLGRESS